MSAKEIHEENETPGAEPLNGVVDEVRRYTVQRLEAGTSPSELSFALAFVATEMGLCVTRGGNTLPVFQAVLQAVTTAAMNEAPTVSAAEAESDAAPAQSTVH